MFIAYIVLAILLSLLLFVSGVGKLRHMPAQVHTLKEVVGLDLKWLPWLAACEFAAVVGLLVGIVWWPLGVAAAIGLVAYFVGATFAHIRVKDFKGMTSPVVILLFAVVVLVIRILSR
jgi:hypothetical protein